MVAHIERLEAQLQESLANREREMSKTPTNIQQKHEEPIPNVDLKELSLLRDKVKQMDSKLAQVLQERDTLQEKVQEKVRKKSILSLFEVM